MPQNSDSDLELPEAYSYRIGPRIPIIADPVGMEFLLDDASKPQRDELLALRLDTLSAVYRLLAEEAAQAAQVIGRGSAR